VRQLMLYRSLGGNVDKFDEVVEEFSKLVIGKPFKKTQDLDILVNVAFSHPNARKIAAIENVDDYLQVRKLLLSKPRIYSQLFQHFAHSLYDDFKKMDPMFAHSLLPLVINFLDSAIPLQLISRFLQKLWEPQEYARYTLGFYEFIGQDFSSYLTPDLGAILSLVEGRVWRDLS
jgi:hypothetical protein